MSEEKITVNYKKYRETLEELWRYRYAAERGEGNGKGAWNERFVDDENPHFWRRFYCTHCNEYNTYGKTPYCPYCGAKMEES